MTNAATVSLIPLSHEAEPPTSREELIELPESETLRGVHIAGFNFAYEEAHESSRVDLSEGDFTMDSAKEGHDEPDGSSKLLEEHHATELTLAEGEDDKAPSSKRTTYTAGLESNYVTPLGSITSNTTSGAGSVPSTALYSCTSFGELRDCVKNETQDVKKPDNLGITDSGDNLQSNAADLLAPRRITSRSDCLSTTATLGDEHTRRESDPARPPSILLRRDTVNTLLSTSTMNSNRPDSSLGGARGMRVRKYASLNWLRFFRLQGLDDPPIGTVCGIASDRIGLDPGAEIDVMLKSPLKVSTNETRLDVARDRGRREPGLTGGEPQPSTLLLPTSRS